MGLVHIDFFINNKCNLHCKHCYVNPEMSRFGSLKSREVIDALNEAISLGVKTIACTGKEPLLDFEKLKEVFQFLYEKKTQNKNILYGIVTNGILLNKEKAKILNDINLDYLDISLDGTEKINDKIRGEGSYLKTIGNLENLLNLNLNNINKRNIFIDFTLSHLNENNLTDLVLDLSRRGLQNIYVSPYQSIKNEDSWVLSPEEYIKVVEVVMADSQNYKNMRLFFKNDYNTKENVDELIIAKVVDLNNLYIDEIGTTYSIIKRDGNEFYFNLLNNKNNNFMLRMNSNGDITTCKKMFKNQKYSSLGNIRDKSISEILKPFR